jgi:hypothetical protein
VYEINSGVFPSLTKTSSENLTVKASGSLLGKNVDRKLSLSQTYKLSLIQQPPEKEIGLI